MKIRIKGSYIRLRLTQTEVKAFCETGYFEEKTVFGPNQGQTFCYALEAKDAIEHLQASYSDNKISVYIPLSLSNSWYDSPKVGFSATMDNGTEDGLQLLVEKDFVCLDDTPEDQSDNYPNPRLA